MFDVVRLTDTEGPAVKAPRKGDDPLSLRAEPCQFESSLDGLGARIAEEETIEPLRGDRRKAFCEARKGFIMEHAARVDEAVRLPPDGIDDGRMIVTRIRRGEAGGEIHVPPALFVFDVEPFRFRDDDRRMDHEGRRQEFPCP